MLLKSNYIYTKNHKFKENYLQNIKKDILCSKSSIIKSWGRLQFSETPLIPNSDFPLTVNLFVVTSFDVF